ADPRGTPRCPPALPGGAAVRHARCVAGARRGRGAPETRARPREGRPLSHRRERGPLSLAPGVAKRATLCARSEALGEMTTKEPGRRGLRVMIVEDEEAVRDVFRDFLAGLGHESIPVATAEDALEKLVSEQPDTILLDIRLPGMSGLDFLELPAVQESGVPIVAVSGVATEAQAGGGEPLDAVALVVRVDKGGAALWFLDLLPHEVQRLRAMVDRLRL